MPPRQSVTNAVTGATGRLGRLVVRRLRSRVPADDIVALARLPQRAADLGVAVREADYARPGTPGPALEGVETLLLISASEPGKRAAQHRRVIEAAKEAGVKRIVYTSLLHADALAGIGLPRGLARAIAGRDGAASQGALFDDSRRLSALIGRRTTPLPAVVSDALARGARGPRRRLRLTGSNACRIIPR